MSDEIPDLLDSLAKRLCERKALKPLWRFLSAYFALNGLTDGWEQCYESLRDVRALCGSELLSDELHDVNLLINKIGQMLDKQTLVQDIKDEIVRSFPNMDNKV